MEVWCCTHVANEKNSSFGVQNWSWIGVGVTKSSDSPNLPSFQVNIYLCINACLKEKKMGCSAKVHIAQYWFFILSTPKCIFLFYSERQHYKLFHALRDLQMSWTQFTEDFCLFVWKLLEHYGTFWNRRENLNLNLDLESSKS